MMLFLQKDTEREHPVGFGALHRNFFDPDEDPNSDQEYHDEDVSSEARSVGGEAASGPGKDCSSTDNASLDLNSDMDSDSMSLDSKRPSSSGSAATNATNDNEKVGTHQGGLPDRADNDSLSKPAAQRAPVREKGDMDTSYVVTTESQNEVLDEADVEDVSFSDDQNDSSSSSSTDMCARVGCCKTPRFDSMFCSDSCGISAVERDLLNAFEYASEIHPSLLRP